MSLQHSPCRHVIITGGNHDSPSMLNAPKDLLRALNVYVIGSATDDLSDELLVLTGPDDKPELIVAAVPFLRDRDLRSSIAGEGTTERVERIKKGIFNHYQAMGELCKPYEDLDIPIITTGHLYAKGAIASDKQDNIYIGNMENIEGRDFPPIFNYVALGHLHRAQVVGEQYHVRYSGSLIPLSFSEISDQKSVTLLNFDGTQFKEGIHEIPVPIFRQLINISGDLKTVQKKLDKVASTVQAEELKAWVEVIVESEKIIPNLDGLLKEYCEDMPLELLKIRTNRRHIALDKQINQIDLGDLETIDVFQKKCESYGSPPEEIEELKDTFKELQNWMTEQEKE
jgi:exonuclease SbcD